MAGSNYFPVDITLLSSQRYYFKEVFNNLMCSL